MSYVITDEQNYTDIADAIRAKLGGSDTYTPSQMATAIGTISGGGSTLGTKSITANGTYAAADDSLDGYSEVTVAVGGGSSTLVTKNISANGTYNASSDNADGYSQVTVNVPNSYEAADEGKVVDNGALVAQTSVTVTANGTYDTTTNDSVTVNVSGGGGVSSGTTPPEASQGSDGDYYEWTHELPNDVTFVEYLESSGSQYIDTGFAADEGTDVWCKSEYVGNNFVAGVRTGGYSSSSNALYVACTGSSETGIVKSGGEVSGTSFTVSKQIGTVCEYATETLLGGSGYVTATSVDGGISYWSGSRSAFSSNGTMILFGLRVSGSVNVASNAVIYRFVIYQDGIPVADFLPCLDGNGVACMWDNMAGEYVYNDGTGNFTAGSTSTPDAIEATLYKKVSGAWTVIR